MNEYPPTIRILAKSIDGEKESLEIYPAIEDDELIVIVLDWMKLPSGRYVPGRHVACSRNLFLNIGGKDFDNTLQPPIDMANMPSEPIDVFGDILDIDPDSYRPSRHQR